MQGEYSRSNQNKNIMSEQQKVKGKAPSTQQSSWVAHAQSAQQKQPERLEETAKFLVGIISICLTIFITNPPDRLPGWAGHCFKVSTALWLASALLAFFVLYPRPYVFNPDVPAEIEAAFDKVTKHKRLLLQLSLVGFLVGLLVASVVVLV